MTTLALGLSIVLAAVHLLAGRLRFLDGIPRSAFLSAAGGISVAYVFVQLLPELAEASETLNEQVTFEHGIYVLALVGLVTFYGIERLGSRKAQRSKGEGAGPAEDVATWFAFATYAIYNGVIGYLLVREHEHVSAVLLFATAIGLHFIVNDHGLREDHGHAYHRAGRWLIAGAVVGGAVLGALTAVHELVIALLVAFIAGGIVLNVMKEELPEERQSRLSAFLAGAGAYTALLLAI